MKEDEGVHHVNSEIQQTSDTTSDVVSIAAASEANSESNTNDDNVYWGTTCPVDLFYGSSCNPHHAASQSPMLDYSSAQTSPHPCMNPYYYRPHPGYSTGQYIPEPGYGAPQLPLPPYPHHFRHSPQQMYYGPWHAYNQSAAVSQETHNPQHSMLPLGAKNSRWQALKSDEGAYGTPKLTKCESAINFLQNNPKATLFDIDGIIFDVVRASEASSHFIQKRLKLGSMEEKRLALTTALSAIDDLVYDQYGYFLLQGLFEFGSADMKKELIGAIYTQDIVALCLHVRGCRVIQKALHCLEQNDLCRLFTEFHDKVFTLILDPNGNHVIQRCIQSMSNFARNAANNGDPDIASSLSDQMQFIIDDIITHIEKLSTHQYGCRVVQRAIEHCVDHQKHAVLDSVISHHRHLLTDQYGNYVVQQLLACGNGAHQAEIVKTLIDNGCLLSLSMHKFASNIVEKVLVHGEPQHRVKLLEEMLIDTRSDEAGYCCLIELAKDPIANYVVNRAIEVSESDYKERICNLILSNRQELSKSPYAKYVLQRVATCDK